MKLRRAFVPLIALIVLWSATIQAPSGALAQVTAVSAPQAQQALCDELQVVFLIDQSGSMFGTGGAEQASDPNFLRLFGTRRAVETLSTLRYQSYRDSTIEVAMLDFGDAPALRKNWTDLTPNTEAEYQQLLDQLNNDGVFKQPDSDRGNTNFLTAFQAASSLFNQKPAQNGPCPARAVIVLTDGQPAGQGIDLDQHMTELKNYVTDYMRPPGYQIYVISIDPTNAYWGSVKPYWEGVTGDSAKATKVIDDRELGSLVIGIAEQLSHSLRLHGPPPKTQCVRSGPIQIPPFTQQLSFTLVKSDPSNRLDLLDERGMPVDQARSDIKVQVQGQGDPIETLTVVNPQPGTWTMRTSLPQEALDRCQIRLLSFSATGQITKPAPNSPIAQFQRVPIELGVLAAGGTPLPKYADPRYALAVTMNISGTGAISQPVTLTAQSAYTFTGELMPLSAGPISIHARAISHNPDQSELVVFDQDLASFAITPVEFVPDQQPSGSLPQYGEVPLSFKLISGGQPVHIDLPVDKKVTLTGPDKQPQDITLKETSDGVYTGTLKLEKPGAYVLAYQAMVKAPNASIDIGKGELPFDVFATSRVSLQIVSPPSDRYVATDLFLRPTGLPLEVQIVDDAGRQLSPGDIGATNPMSLFTVQVLDSNKKDVAAGLPMNPTGKPGLFRLADNKIGTGTYEVVVLPATELSRNYVWEQKSWSKTVNGGINLWFFALLAAALALIGSIVALVIAWMRARVNPLSGYIQIFKLQPLLDGSSEWRQIVMQRSLPARNRAVITPSSGLLGLIEHILPVSFASGNPIRRVILTCPDANNAKAGHALAQITLKNGRQITQKVGPDLPSIALEFGYYLAKGPQRGSIGGIGDGMTLSDTYETPVERR